MLELKRLTQLEREAAQRMAEILRSHCIAPGALRTDRFWEFYAARAEALLQRIAAATGKSITREPELFRAGVLLMTGTPDRASSAPVYVFFFDDDNLYRSHSGGG